MADQASRMPAEAESVPSPVSENGGPRPDGAHDYYAVLGIDPDCPQEQVAAAYRRQAAHYLRRPTTDEHLRLLSAAYSVLGDPSRRADYDRMYAAMRQPPMHVEPIDPPASGRRRPPLHRRTKRTHHGGHPIELAGVLMIAIVALATGILLAERGGIDIGRPISGTAEQLGLTSGSIFLPESEVAPPSPAQALTDDPLPPPAPPQEAVPLDEQFAGTEVRVEPSEPRPGSQVTVTTTVLRNGQPAAFVPLHLVAHYRTVVERWPAGAATVLTDERGVAQMSFNIGNATPGYTVKVDVIARVDDQEVVWHGAFTPRS